MLTAQQVYDAFTALDSVLRRARRLPLSAIVRLGNMLSQLQPHYTRIAAERAAIIASYDQVDEAGAPAIPADKVDDFATRWGTIAASTVNVDCQPIRLSQLDLGATAAAVIPAAELLALQSVITDDTPAAA